MALFEFKESDLPLEVPFRMSVAGSTGKKSMGVEHDEDSRKYSFLYINISNMGILFRERQKLLHYEIDRQCLLHAQ